MKTSHLDPGATLECNVRGLHFTAILEKREGPWLLVKPLSRSITYRRLKPRQILRKVERQESLV